MRGTNRETNMEHRLLALWDDMFDHVGTRTIKEQTDVLAVFNGWYKKATVQEQGEYHYLLHVRNKKIFEEKANGVV